MEWVLNNWILSIRGSGKTQALELLFLFHTDDQTSGINGNSESFLHDDSWVTHQALTALKGQVFTVLKKLV